MSDTPRVEDLARKAAEEISELFPFPAPSQTSPVILRVINEALAERDEELAHKQKIIENSCRDWADDDTLIKTICAKHGIKEDDTPDFKDMVTCVEELSEKFAAVAKEREQIVAEANQRIEGLEISVEAAKANATCIAKALGDVTEERDAIRKQLGDLLDEMEEQLLK